MTSSNAAMRASDARFRTTHGPVVLTAGRSGTPRAQAAREKPGRVYWRPLDAYVRRRGHSPEDTADLTQEFFGCSLEQQSLADIRLDEVALHALEKEPNRRDQHTNEVTTDVANMAGPLRYSHWLAMKRSRVALRWAMAVNKGDL